MLHTIGFLAIALLFTDRHIAAFLGNSFLLYGSWLSIVVCLIVAYKYLGSPFKQIEIDEEATERRVGNEN